MEEIIGLAQYGSTGVIIALIVLVSVVIYKMFEVVKAYQLLMGDNFKNLTESFNKNSKVLDESVISMKEIQEVIKNCRYNCR